MAATELTVQEVDRSGLEVAYTSMNADGHLVDNAIDRRMFIAVKNGSGGAIVVTVVTQSTVDDLAVTDLTVSVPAGEDRWIGPFPGPIYNTSGQIEFSVDSATSVTVAAVRLPNA